MGNTWDGCGSGSKNGCCGRGPHPTELVETRLADANGNMRLIISDVGGTPRKLQGTPRKPRVSIVQAAGHLQTIRMDIDDCEYILKPYDEAEVQCYESLQEADSDPIRGYVAQFGGIVEVQLGTSHGTAAVRPSCVSQKFMRLTNLLHDFTDVMIMDVKMGIRTFQESEASNPKKRGDLYEKLKKLSPEHLTAEDHEAKAITKHRWMSTNDSLKTTTKYGFRIDGLTSREGDRANVAELDSIKNTEDMMPVLARLLPRVGASDPTQKRKRIAVAMQVLAQLELLQCSLESSPFFAQHEFIGTSLLFITHSYGAHVHLIDLAKTERLPAGLSIDHRSPWKQGNHEDGFLFGLEGLRDCWKRALTSLQKADSQPTAGIFRQTQYDKEMKQLERVLKEHGVTVELFGIGGTKTLQELHCDIYMKEVARIQIADSGEISRFIEIVRAWIGTPIRGKPHVLMCEYPKTEPNGDMITITKTFAKKIHPKESWNSALKEALSSRFGLAMDVVERHFNIKQDTYKLNVERKIGKTDVRGGYPGLNSIYEVHEVDVAIFEPTSPELESMGLPDGDDIVTVEHGKYFGSSLKRWTWTARCDVSNDHW